MFHRQRFILLTVMGAGCSPRLADFPSSDDLGAPDSARVETVVFLVGDAGKAKTNTSPLFARLRDNVEAWSARLPPNRVVVLYLGDNVYETGVHETSSPQRPQDLEYLATQVDVLRGTAARERQTRGIFIPGNHDWGNLRGQSGAARLALQESAVGDAADSTGAAVSFLPAGGCPGPDVLDVGLHTRIILMDTNWWLQGRERPDSRRCRATTATEAVLALTTALRGARARHVVLAAHHPLVSGGSHGGNLPVVGVHGVFIPEFGLLYLASRSGTIVQDINAAPYQEFVRGIDSAIAVAGKRPLVHAAGHDHNLQVIRSDSPSSPQFQLVSGSASKVKYVGPVDGTMYAAAQPGYMQLAFTSDGTAELRVIAGEVQECPEDPEPARTACLDREARKFVTVYSTALN
jgi:hypothetical protein